MDCANVVLDVGSHSVKVGLSTAGAPEVLPSIAGRFKYRPVFGFSGVNAAHRQGVAGRDVASNRGLLRLSYPIQHGTVRDWQAMHALLDQAQVSLSAPYTTAAAVTPAPSAQSTSGAIVPSVTPAVLSSSTSSMVYSLIEPPFASRVQRHHLVERLLESGGYGAGADSGRRGGVSLPPVRGVFCGVAPLLALYSTGETSGVVVDVGEGVVSTAAALNGFALTDVMQRQDGVATGGAVTAQLTKLMRQYGTLQTASYEVQAGVAGGTSHGRRGRGSLLDINGGAETELVREVKEHCSSVSPVALPAIGPVDCSPVPSSNPEAVTGTAMDALLMEVGRHAMPPHRRQTHVLPDGVELSVGVEAIYATEVLFSPELGGSEGRGVADMALATVALAEAEARPPLLAHVVVVGGTSLTSGFGARFLSELLQRSPRGNKVRVVAPAERGYAAWTGACFVSELSTFHSQMVVSRAEYEEHGESILQARLYA